MLVSYPALFYFLENEPVNYYIYFPDIKSTGTQGTDIPDAMSMASDWLGIMLADDITNERPVANPSNINDLSLKTDAPQQTLNFDPTRSFISIVNVDLTNYLTANHPIKKTLTIPQWADKIGQKLNINFSQTLTDAILAKNIKTK